MSNEEWRPVPSLGGWYDASSLGRVRTWKVGGRSKERKDEPLVMKLTETPRYMYVAAYGRGQKPRNRLVHQLVAEAFFGPPPPRHIVRHKNNDGKDNRLSNLEYGTNSQNQLDRIAHNTSNRGTANGTHKLTEKEVLLVIDKRKQGLSHAAIAAEMGVSRKTISKILAGDTWGWLTGIVQ